MNIDIGEFPGWVGDWTKYTNNEDFVWPLFMVGPSQVKANFATFDIEYGWDYFSVLGLNFWNASYTGWHPQGWEPEPWPTADGLLYLFWQTDDSVGRTGKPRIQSVKVTCPQLTILSPKAIQANKRVDGILTGTGNTVYLYVDQPANSSSSSKTGPRDLGVIART